MAEKKYEIHRVKDEDRFRVGMELTHGLRKVDGREMELAGGRLVWCLGTPLIKAHKLAFAMESKRILSRWARKYGVLWNYVASFNQDALAWLEWCGAEFFELPAWKGRKERFVRFEIRGGE